MRVEKFGLDCGVSVNIFRVGNKARIEFISPRGDGLFVTLVLTQEDADELANALVRSMAGF